MSLKERIIHTILYELGCIIVGMIFMWCIGEDDVMITGTLTVSMSVLAAFWSFAYNWLFDKVVRGPRVERSPNVRTIHAILLEGGFMIFTTPLIAYMLEMSLWEAFIADLVLTLIVMVFTYVYNWIYDRARLLFVTTG